MVSQNVIPSRQVLGGAKPFAFTETGVAMLSSVLKSKKAIEINPKNHGAYLGLGWIYQSQNNLSRAEEVLEEAIRLNPNSEMICYELGWLYWDLGKFSQAEEVFKKAVKLMPDYDRVFKALAVFYEATGRSRLIEEYDRKKLRLRYYTQDTVNNYRKLKKILDKRKIKLICVQYPMRDIEPLKKIFQGEDKGIIFIDNEKIFKDVLKKVSHGEYFIDMFGGDFGHCTPKGNRLLAENIANVILKEIFNK